MNEIEKQAVITFMLTMFESVHPHWKEYGVTNYTEEMFMQEQNKFPNYIQNAFWMNNAITKFMGVKK